MLGRVIDLEIDCSPEYDDCRNWGEQQEVMHKYQPKISEYGRKKYVMPIASANTPNEQSKKSERY